MIAYRLLCFHQLALHLGKLTDHVGILAAVIQTGLRQLGVDIGDRPIVVRNAVFQIRRPTGLGGANFRQLRPNFRLLGLHGSHEASFLLIQTGDLPLQGCHRISIRQHSLLLVLELQSGNGPFFNEGLQISDDSLIDIQAFLGLSQSNLDGPPLGASVGHITAQFVDLRVQFRHARLQLRQSRSLGRAVFCQTTGLAGRSRAIAPQQRPQIDIFRHSHSSVALKVNNTSLALAG